MKVQIEVGKGIQCDGIEIMFGDSISSVVKAVVPGLSAGMKSKAIYDRPISDIHWKYRINLAMAYLDYK